MVSCSLPKVSATRVRFGLRLLFPLNEDFSIPLVRLMLATDDVRHLLKLLVGTRDDGPEASASDRAIREGELGHFFRLMCGHLHEAMDAFAVLDKKCAALLDRAANEARGPDDAVERVRARNALAKVRSSYRSILSTNGRRSFISVVRNFVGFHYNPQKLRRTLDKHDRAGHLEGMLVLSFSGLGRYTVTDRLTTFLIADEIGGDIGEFQQKYMREIGEVIEVGGALRDVVDYLIAHLLGEHLDEIEQHDELITIDPALARAKEQRDRERGTDQT